VPQDTTTELLRLSSVLPEGAGVNGAGHLQLGGCDSLALLQSYGSPLYVLDEQTLRRQCRRFIEEFGGRYHDVGVLYASKAFANVAIARIVAEEGLGLDVVSGGELAVALRAGFPAERVYFHGNNKSAEELAMALESGTGRIIIDKVHELDVLEAEARQRGCKQAVLLRISPSVDPHTHAHTTTGILDSKFGFPIETGQAEEGVARAQRAEHLELRGLHAHLGSPIFELDPYERAIEVLIGFAAEMRSRHGFELREFSPGGGFAAQYLAEQPAPPLSAYAEVIVDSVRRWCAVRAMPLPHLTIEPGRSLICRSGVALYTVGASKDIPGIRRYVAVDGGMADNIRPAIYGARYEALLANRPQDVPDESVTIAGKYCESGDILIRDARLPRVGAGDIIAIPASGAYCLAMSSNYNCATRPAVVLVGDGEARLIRRRETYDDVIRMDVDS
jgi:diaminopimelate decarboxylase